MFSASGASAVIRTGSRRSAAPSVAATTAAAPPMSLRISFMPSTRLDRDAAGVEGDALADQHDVGARRRAGARPARPGAGRWPSRRRRRGCRRSPRRPAASGLADRDGQLRRARPRRPPTCSANHCGLFCEDGRVGQVAGEHGSPRRWPGPWPRRPRTRGSARRATGRAAPRVERVGAAPRRRRQPEPVRGQPAAPRPARGRASGSTSAGSDDRDDASLRGGAGQRRAGAPASRPRRRRRRRPAAAGRACARARQLGAVSPARPVSRAVGTQCGGLVGQRRPAGVRPARRGSAECRLPSPRRRAHRQDERSRSVGLGDRDGWRAREPYLRTCRGDGPRPRGMPADR